MRLSIGNKSVKTNAFSPFFCSLLDLLEYNRYLVLQIQRGFRSGRSRQRTESSELMKWIPSVNKRENHKKCRKIILRFNIQTMITLFGLYYVTVSGLLSLSYEILKKQMSFIRRIMCVCMFIVLHWSYEKICQNYNFVFKFR